MPSVDALTVPIRVNPVGFEPSSASFLLKIVKIEYLALINALRHSLSILWRCGPFHIVDAVRRCFDSANQDESSGF